MRLYFLLWVYLWLYSYCYPLIIVNEVNTLAFVRYSPWFSTSMIFYMVSEAWFLGQPWSWMFPLPCNVLFLSPIRLLMLLRILALPKLLTCAPHHIIILTPVSTSLLLELWTRCNFVYQSILSNKLMITISMNYKDNHLCIHQPSTFFKIFCQPSLFIHFRKNHDKF